MKKFIKCFIVLILCLVSFVGFIGCKSSEDNILSIYMPDGAPALSMSKIMYEQENFGFETANYSVVSASNISNYILQKTADVAIIPVNMASKLLASGEYKVVATATNGNIFVAGNKDIVNLSDLKGEVVGVIGQGNVPDLNFRYLLSEAGIQYEIGETAIDGKVVIRYYSEASNLLPMLKNEVLNFGLLPEPAVSKLLSLNNKFNIELDIQKLWQGGSYPQAVVVVRNTLCNNSKFIDNLCLKMQENESWVIENPAIAIDAINAHYTEGVVPSLSNTLSSKTIERCNIKIRKTTSEEINRITDYLSAIKTIESSAVGNNFDNIFWEF
ncbi:MAG: hypothetical protein IJW59_02000 [Clostridia bacterium]|nr:hypothetical protein [Clostridia bacterium]